jgi:hypothetical protein
MSMQHFPVNDVKVYQLNICDALGHHDECVGMDTLSVEFHEIGMVVCNCRCHGNPESEPN